MPLRITKLDVNRVDPDFEFFDATVNVKTLSGSRVLLKNDTEGTIYVTSEVTNDHVVVSGCLAIYPRESVTLEFPSGGGAISAGTYHPHTKISAAHLY